MRRFWLSLLLTLSLVSGGVANAWAAGDCPYLKDAVTSQHSCCPDDAAKMPSHHGDESDKTPQCKLGQACRTMLQQWEEGPHEHSEVWERWQQMDQWVWDGFSDTYQRMGIAFDRVERESNTYKVGKDIVQAHTWHSTWCDMLTGAPFRLVSSKAS